MGKVVEITVRNPTHKGKIFYYNPPTVTFQGELIPNPEWIASDCITITGDEFTKFRIIKKADIVGNPVIEPPTTKKTYQVTGSKGDIYTVTRDGNIWICTCTGFHYRNTCKHVNAMKDKEQHENHR